MKNSLYKIFFTALLAIFILKLPLIINLPPSYISHDGAHFLEVARNILANKKIITYSFWRLPKHTENIPFFFKAQMPLYPLLTALLCFLLKINLLLAGRIISSLAYAAGGALLIVLAAKFYRAKKNTVLVFFLYLFYWQFLIFSNMPLAEMLFIFEHIAVFTMLFSLYRRKNLALGENILFSAGLALICLTKLQGIITALFVYLWLIFARKRINLTFRQILFSLTCFSVLFAPYAAAIYFLEPQGDIAYLILQDFYPHKLPSYFAHSLVLEGNILKFILIHKVALLHTIVKKTYFIFSDLFREPLFFFFLIAFARRKKSRAPEFFAFSFCFSAYAIIIYTVIHYEFRYLSILLPLWILFSPEGIEGYINIFTRSKKNIFYFTLIAYPLYFFAIHYRLYIKEAVSQFRFFNSLCLLGAVGLLIIFVIALKENKRKLAALFVLVFLLFHYIAKNKEYGFSIIRDKRYIISETLTKHLRPLLKEKKGQTILDGSGPHYLAYLLPGQKIISFPYSDKNSLRKFIYKYHINFVALPRSELMLYTHSRFKNNWPFLEKIEEFKCGKEKCLIFKVKGK